ncbi:MAG: S-layer homology domain-containing protein, partial [Clostridia bacterium]|nr:S-layer homology domain-containing protein [Clostridia bacterium]
TPIGLEAGVEYLYYATLTDSSGNVTVTPVYLFTEIDRVDYELEAAKAELKAILEALPAFEEGNYTEDSWDMFISAKFAAENLLETAESADLIREAITNINNASNGLTLRDADYSRVEAAIGSIPANTDGYTAASLEKLTKAVEAVVYDLDITHQAEVDAMAQAIEEAVAALKVAISFTDVKESHWFYNAVMYSAERGIFKGNPDGSFAPNKAITRAEFVMVLANYSGEDYSAEECDKFTDVKSSAWYYRAMAWAANRGIVNGMTPDTFAPTKTITRQDLCLMLTNYLKYKGIELEESSSETFADDSKIGAWAYDAVYAIKAIGVVSGMGNNEFQPRGNATRAQVAQMMLMFDQYLNK